jgi:hypothetical protein
VDANLLLGFSGAQVSRRNQIDAFGESHEDVEELRLPVRRGAEEIGHFEGWLFGLLRM